MFEKDAEEQGRKKHKDRITRWEESQSEDVIEGFKDGAEFGYNKCFEQIRKVVNEHTRLDCIIPELLRLQENE